MWKYLLAIFGTVLVWELWYFYPKQEPDWGVVKESVVFLTVDVTTTTVKTDVQSFRMDKDGKLIVVLTSATVTTTEHYVGTGWVVTRDGFIVTCAHMVHDVPGAIIDVKVHFFGAPGAYFKPQVIYANFTSDMALLKINVGVPLMPLKVGSSDEVGVGDPLYVMGNPHGYTWSAYKTMLSAKRFIWLNKIDDEDTALERYVLQLQDPIAPGISGSPVLDKDGRVVCMANAAAMAKNVAQINWCSPVEEIKWMLETQGVMN